MGAERKQQQLILVDIDQLRSVIGEAVAEGIALARAQAPANETPWLNSREVCELLRITEPTLAKWINEEGLPSTQVGQVRRFHREQVQAWLDARTPKRKAK